MSFSPSLLTAQADHITPMRKVEELSLTLLGDASLQFLPYNRATEDGTSKPGALAGGIELSWPVNRLQARWNLINTAPDKLIGLQDIGHHVLLPQIGADFRTIELEHQLITDTPENADTLYSSWSWSNAVYMTQGNWLSNQNPDLEAISAVVISLGTGVRTALHKEKEFNKGSQKSTLDVLASFQFSTRFAVSDDVSLRMLRNEYLRTHSNVFPGLVVHGGLLLNGFGVTVNFTYFDDINAPTGLSGATGFNFTIGLLLRGDIFDFPI